MPYSVAAIKQPNRCPSAQVYNWVKYFFIVYLTILFQLHSLGLHNDTWWDDCERWVWKDVEFFLAYFKVFYSEKYTQSKPYHLIFNTLQIEGVWNNSSPNISLTNSMQQSPYWEAKSKRCRKIPFLLWKCKVHYHALPHYVDATFAQRFTLTLLKYEFQQLWNIINIFLLWIQCKLSAR
jgi:hypothetical protein